MQKIYTLQVRNRGEQKYIKLFKNQHSELPFTLYAPLRCMPVRRKGVVSNATSMIFPGYIFVETVEEDSFTACAAAFRRIPGFFRFLKNNQNICPLAGRDLKLVLHFIRAEGAVAGLSKVYLNENSRIVVIEGPLLGLEGKIIKIDKRKGRAKIKLDLYDDSFAIDLPFELLDRTADSL